MTATKTPIDILFINPPLTARERYGSLAAAGERLVPLGLCSLAAAARQAGYGAAIIDAEAECLTPEEVAEQARRIAPRCVGVTAVTVSMENAASIARLIRKALPGVPLLLGGVHVSALPLETMQRYPEFDYGVVGEGERTLVEFLRALPDGRVAAVSGMLAREGGTVVFTGARAPIEELDSLPQPAWDLLKGFPERYFASAHTRGGAKVASVFTSRGCYGKCLFCSNTVFGTRVRFHGTAYVLAQLRRLTDEYGVREIWFEDDNIAASPERLRELCDALIEAKLGIAWNCFARADRVSPELLRLMRRAGCWQIAYGFESGSQRVLDFLQKGMTVAQYRDAVRWTREAGIRVKGLFITGCPGETRADGEATLRFALENPLDDLSITYFTPFPGTPLYATAAGFGSFEDDWRRMNQLTPLFIPKDMSKEELTGYAQRLLRRFYFRPRIILGYWRNVRSARHFLRLAHSALCVLRFGN